MHTFNAQAFLDSAGLARTIVASRRGEAIFSQGDASDSGMYVQKKAGRRVAGTTGLTDRGRVNSPRRGHVRTKW